MFYISDLRHTADDKYRVGFIHYQPFDPLNGLNKTKEELEQSGFFIDSLPEPEHIEGKIPVLYADPENKRVYYEYVDKPITIDKRVEDLEQFAADLTYQLMMKGVL